ncbi:SRPBCC family protein, partial [Streptomyces sp. M2CJ-2]|uniref:SRPBCC family protein n=1 Tax=Streptomyces sp. M2CJ-2 TaxID=2803948 RepID=UPI001928AD7E
MKTDTRSTSRLRHDPLVRGLGWGSALLGVPQVVAPAGFARALGVGDTSRHRSATTAVGVRELAAATGLLGRPHPAWLWGRVGGDLMDLAALARALKNHNGRGLGRTVAATAAVTAITATDVYAAVTRTRRSTPMELTAATTVTRPPDEVYSLWSDLERLPDFMAHLDEVRATGPRTTHWRASAPFGRTVEWDAETTEDVPGRLIAWQSADGADIGNSGEVRLVPAPGDRGTEIRVTLHYDLPGGALGKTAARYFPSSSVDGHMNGSGASLSQVSAIRPV